MKSQIKDENTLRRYLLGDISPEELEKVEFWLMSEDEAYDLLEAAEDDLIDDALANKLTNHQMDQFKERFLAAPERQRKLRFSRSLQRCIDAANALPAPQPFSLWDALAACFR